jgi:hypothetical protein
MAKTPAAIAALAQTEGIFQARTPARHFGKDVDYLNVDCVPYQPTKLFEMELEIDYQELIKNLRNRSDFSQMSQRQVTVGFNPIDEKRIKVWQLAPLSVTLLRLCDGKRTVGEIVQEFSQLEIGLDGVPADKACLFGLMQLRQDGLIAVSSCPLLTEEDAGATEFQKATMQYPPRITNTQQPWPAGELV